MSVEARREQLLAIGAELFASAPYDEVWIEEVADRAGISRGLLYHYFPNKREFLLSVVRHECERILELTDTDESLPLDQRVDNALEAFLGFVEGHEASFRLLNMGKLSADEAIREVVDSCEKVQQERILRGLQLAGVAVVELTGVVVRAWFAMMRSMCFEWLDHHELTRDQVKELGAQTLLANVCWSIGEPLVPMNPVLQSSEPAAAR
jgi:AcrR family transcriptional regulator